MPLLIYFFSAMSNASFINLELLWQVSQNIKFNGDGTCIPSVYDPEYSFVCSNSYYMEVKICFKNITARTRSNVILTKICVDNWNY